MGAISEVSGEWRVEGDGWWRITKLNTASDISSQARLELPHHVRTEESSAI